MCDKCPIEFHQYMTYVRSLKFEERPNYDYLRSLFETCSISEGITLNNTGFDWTPRLFYQMVKEMQAGDDDNRSNKSIKVPKRSTKNLLERVGNVQEDRKNTQNFPTAGQNKFRDKSQL